MLTLIDKRPQYKAVEFDGIGSIPEMRRLAGDTFDYALTSSMDGGITATISGVTVKLGQFLVCHPDGKLEAVSRIDFAERFEKIA